MQTFAARVSRVHDLTGDVRELELVLVNPSSIAFLAGQFVSFSIPVTGGRPLTRPYSVSSPPSRAAAIDLLFNLVPGGPGSTYLYSLRLDDPVEFRGPAGTFVVRGEDKARPLLFVAIGTGIAPIRSMIHDLLPHSTPVTLFWGLRHERDLYFQAEFSALTQRHPEFSFTTTLSQPSPAWRGAVGRVQPKVRELLDRWPDAAVYACGSSAFIQSVRGIVRAAGTGPVRWEQYYRTTVESEKYEV